MINTLNNDFNKFSKEWTNTFQYNEFIYDHFLLMVSNFPILENHFRIVEQTRSGFGEKAFQEWKIS